MDASASFEIINELGLHARAAAKLVHVASRFQADVFAEKDGRSVNAKSVMGLLLLCTGKGASILIRAHGRDAQEAVDAVGALIADRFGEPR